MQTSTIATLSPPSSCRFILGTRVDVIDYAQAVRKILQWARQRYSGFVCAANVHVVMEGFDSSEYREMINSADMVTPVEHPRHRRDRNARHPRDVMDRRMGTARRRSGGRGRIGSGRRHGQRKHPLCVAGL